MRDIKPDDSNGASAMEGNERRDYPRSGIAPPGPGVRDDVGSDFSTVMSALSRHRILIIATVLICLGAGLLFIRLVEPLFEAEALILIEPQELGAAGVQPAVASINADEAAVRSEIYILTSTELVRRVVERFKLGEDPEFTRTGKPGLFSSIGDSLESISDSGNAAVIDKFLERLNVNVYADSRVISVSFKSSDPERAQTIANAVAAAYMGIREELKLESSSRFTNWIEDQINELEEQVSRGEKTVEALRQEYGIVEGTGGDLRAQELAQVSTQLILTRAERAGIGARLEQARALLESPDGLKSAIEALDSPMLQSLRTDYINLQAEVAELSSELGPEHPRLLQLQAETAELRSEIDVQIRNLIAGLQNQYNVARSRERSVQADLGRLERKVSTNNEKAIQIRALERGVDADQALLTSLLRRQKETVPQNQSGFLRADARLISEATMPTEIAFPNSKIVIGLSVFSAIMLSGLLILVREISDKGFRSAAQLEADLPVAALGFVPKSIDISNEPSDLSNLRDHPSSGFPESIRTTLWNLALLYSNDLPKILTVTSSVVSEGKSTLVTGLSAGLADTGRSVVVIDADVRLPSLHDRFNTNLQPGLVDYLSDDEGLSNRLQSCPGIANLQFIAAGISTKNAPALLAGERFRMLLEELSGKFDHIVIDSPPVLVSADAQILSNRSDATIFVVRWGETPRQTVKHAYRLLERSGAKVAGVVLNNVDASKYSRYTYGDSGQYTKRYAAYYQ